VTLISADRVTYRKVCKSWREVMPISRQPLTAAPLVDWRYPATNQGGTRSLAADQMTLDDAPIPARVADTHGLAPVVEQGLHRIIAEQMTTFVWAVRYERTAMRHDHRNGTRIRFWATRVGRGPLRVPRVRGGGF